MTLRLPLLTPEQDRFVGALVGGRLVQPSPGKVLATYAAWAHVLGGADIRDQNLRAQRMTKRRTAVGREVEEGLGEVLAHVRGEVDLPCRIVDDPSAQRIRALRKRMKLSRQKFADRFGLDVRALQDWEQGRRVPDRAARVLLTVIDREPEVVARALAR